MRVCDYFVEYLKGVLPRYSCVDLDVYNVWGVDAIYISRNGCEICRVDFSPKFFEHYDNVYYLADPEFDFGDLVCDIIGCDMALVSSLRFEGLLVIC